MNTEALAESRSQRDRIAEAIKAVAEMRHTTGFPALKPANKDGV